MALSEPRLSRIEGRNTLIVPTGSGLPRKLDELLRQMSGFGFTYAADIALAGTRIRAPQGVSTLRIAWQAGFGLASRTSVKSLSLASK